MAKNRPNYDVFLSYNQSDQNRAMNLATALEGHGLSVFFDVHALAVGERDADLSWEAMAESYALVILVPNSFPTPWISFEVGAASAWNKPVYAVSQYVPITLLERHLPGVQIFPWNTEGLRSIVNSILGELHRLDGQDAKLLSDAYSRIGVSVDQLALHPQELDALVNDFNKSSGRSMSNEQILSQLLRLRKQSRLGPATDSSTRRRP